MDLDLDLAINNYKRENNMNINLNKITESNFDLIPDGTVATCMLTITPGNYYTDLYTDGFATKSKSSEAVYLNAKYELLDGEYKHRIVQTTIGLFSEKSSLYAEIGLQTMKKIIRSAYGIEKNIEDPRFNIQSYKELDGLTCICQIKVKAQEYQGTKQMKNEVVILTPENVLYQEFQLKSKPITTPVKLAPKVLLDDEIPF